MIKIVAYLAICAVLFGAGLGLSLVLDVVPRPEAPTEGEGFNVLEPEISDVVPGDPEADLLKLDSADADSGPAPTQLPVAVRGKPLSAEELFRFGAMYREQQDALTKRSKEIETRSARLKLIRDDLTGSRKEFDGFRAQVRDLLQKTEQAAVRAQQNQLQEPSPAPTQAETKQEQPAATTSSSTSRAMNMRKIASWMESLPAEKAAQYLRELSNEGKMDSAVDLMGKIEERNVAKILDALDNQALVYKLTEAFRTEKRTDSTSSRRMLR